MKVRDGYKMTKLGEVPQKWEVFGAGDVFDTVSIKNCPNERVLTVTQDRGTIYRDDCGINIKTMRTNLKSFKQVQPGNFIISLRSFQGGLEYSNISGIVSPAYTILNNSKNINKIFYKFFFKSEKFIKSLDSAIIGIRDGKQISFEVFKSIKIPYPPIKEQQRIGEILSSNDVLISKNDALIEKTKEIKQGLMQELLTRGIGHPDFKDSELGEIPKEWSVKKLGEVLEKIIGGGTPSREVSEYYLGNIPWATVKDLNGSTYKNSTIEYITDDAVKNSSTNVITPYNVIVATRMALGRGFINKVPMAINQDLKALIPVDYIDNLYLLYWFLSNELLISSMGTGSTVKGIRLEQLKELLIPVPSLKEQKEIAIILNSLNEKIKSLEKRKQRLIEIKKGLMQDLLTGRVRVNTD